MLTFFKIRKLRQRCLLLAVEWVKELAGATEEQALAFLDSHIYFDDNFYFDLTKSEEYNTDQAILNTLNKEMWFNIDVTGIRSPVDFHMNRIIYALSSVYVAHLMTEIKDPVPNGFLSSTIGNRKFNLLEFMSNFGKWRKLPVALADGRELSVEDYLLKDN